MIPPSCRRWIRWSLFPLLVCGVLLTRWVRAPGVLAPAGAWLNVGQSPAETDYVLVLPGDSATRPYVAAALINAGFADEAILLKCRIVPETLNGNLPGHEVERKVLLARGIPEHQIR